MFRVIPDSLHFAINAKLDEALADLPAAEVDRDHLYRQLLDAFDEHGVIPDFRIEPVTAIKITTEPVS
jgi:LPS O-antigen subunit length determinant protein (WzzB/FepE family)